MKSDERKLVMKKTIKIRLVSKSQKRLKPKFRFKKKRAKIIFKSRYEKGYCYAFVLRKKRDKGWYASHNSQEVKLFVYDKAGNLVPRQIPHSAIIQDPWASVGLVPRDTPPKCVWFQKPPKQAPPEAGVFWQERKGNLPKYIKLGGQSKVKGTRVLVSHGKAN